MSESQRAPKQTVWVVLRHDVFMEKHVRDRASTEESPVDWGRRGETPLDPLEVYVTVKEILPSEDEARREVERLNDLRDEEEDGRIHYVAMPGRYYPEGRNVELGY